ncbi:MAG: hypothetical protein HOG83_05875 [Lentimicrobiaceae bacterium]|nr:hypothetical protein [Lentimicrobiaceae bacterium]
MNNISWLNSFGRKEMFVESEKFDLSKMILKDSSALEYRLIIKPKRIINFFIK